MSKKRLFNSIKVLSFIVVMALFFWIVNPENLYSFLLNQDIGLILDSILFLVLSHIVYAFRWALIIKLGSKCNNFYNPFISFLVGLFYSSFTPANAGGDIYRIYADSSSINNKSYILGLLLFERLIGLIIFLSCSMIAFSNVISFFSNQSQSNFVPIFILALLAMLFCLVLFKKSIIERIKGIGFISESLQIVKKSFFNKKLTFISLAISFAGVLICVLSFDLFIKENGITIPFWTLFGIFCAIELIRSLPISFQGFGFREGFFAFSVVGMGSWSLEEAIYIAGLYYVLVSFALAATGFTAFTINNILSHFYTGYDS